MADLFFKDGRFIATSPFDEGILYNHTRLLLVEFQ